jgi:hypothetical protein
VSPAGVRGSVKLSTATGTSTSNVNSLLGTTSEMFVYTMPPEIRSSRTKVGLALGGTVMPLDLNHVPNGRPVYAKLGCCLFVTSADVAGYQASVILPAHTSDNTTVAVSMNEEEYSSPAYVYITSAMNITSAIPGRVPTSGGSMVRVTTLTPMPSIGAVSCSIGGSYNEGKLWTEVAAEFITGSTLQGGSAVLCGVPARNEGFRSIEISVPASGQVSFGWPTMQLQYSSRTQITGIYPMTGPTSGASLVTVTGTNFHADFTACNFGTKSVMATVISSTEARCVAPAALEGTVAFKITMGREIGSLQENLFGINFVYHNDVRVAKLSTHDPAVGWSCGVSPCAWPARWSHWRVV